MMSFWTLPKFSIFIMTKLIYLFPVLLTPFAFHKSILSKENGFLRNKYQILSSVVVSDEEDTTTSEKKSTDNRENLYDHHSSSSNEYTPEALADQITDLPGLNFTPSFAQFSGYLSVSPTRKIHYWYIESMNDPSNDPVVFWTNGGPGCSGLLGLGTEMGPFIFNSGGKLTLNPFTWNSIANILYVEQPAGVGFSTFSDPDDAYVGDERASLDNFVLISQFFDRFPERKQNEFYIASESFGGHYIPHLAKTILDNSNTKNSIDNFRGFLVGNPYVDPFSNDVTMIQTYYMHGLIALPLFSKWELNCLDRSEYDGDKCNELINAMMEGAGDGINPYALDFPACTEPNNDDYPPQEQDIETTSSSVVLMGADINSISSPNRRKMMKSSQSTRLLNVTSIKSPPFLTNGDVYHPCAEAHLFTYLNRDDVKEALHVETGKNWSMCTDDIKYSEEDSDKPQIYLYEELIAFGRQSGSNLKMMVFSGDDDSICSTASTQYWIWDIGAKANPNEFYKPWTYENQTAGYVTNFDLGNDTISSFTFATVHGAGHEVPAYKPAEALALFKAFFSGNWDTKT